MPQPNGWPDFEPRLLSLSFLHLTSHHRQSEGGTFGAFSDDANGTTSKKGSKINLQGRSLATA
jgi:hypothetical protein